MATATDAPDMMATRVPFIIPFSVAAALGVIQLFLGSSIIVTAMCVAAIVVTFIPLALYGRDIYSLIAIVFSTRYVTVALILKILYGQPLDSNLFHPVESYALTLALMIIITAIVMFARRLDPGKQLFNFPTDPKSLRRLAIISFTFGMACLAVIASKSSDDGGGASAGPLLVIVSSLGALVTLGLVAEAYRAIQLSGGKGLMSPFLAAMLTTAALAVMILNARGFLLDCIITVVVVGFVYRAITWRVVVGGVLFLAFFVNFFSPLTLYLRGQRGGSSAAFAEVAISTAGRMIVDPTFRAAVTTFVKNAHLQTVVDDEAWDYYGDRSNVGNRLSFVALLDGVYTATRSHVEIGAPAVVKSLSGVMPGFLGFKKEAVGMGDWLSWRTGMLEYPKTSYLIYGLPMEGLATWGLIGFFVYPFLFFLPVMLIYPRVATFRTVTPVSIFLFMMLQAELIEMTSDTAMNLVMRHLPVAIAALFAIYYLTCGGRIRPKRLSEKRPVPVVVSSADL